MHLKKTQLGAVNYDVKPKVSAGTTAQDYGDPCEAMEVSELSSVYRRHGLACTTCLRQVLKNGLQENIVFAQEPSGTAQSRQRRKQLMYLPLPHTHIQRKKHAARVLIFPCSLF